MELQTDGQQSKLSESVRLVAYGPRGMKAHGPGPIAREGSRLKAHSLATDRRGRTGLRMCPGGTYSDPKRHVPQGGAARTGKACRDGGSALQRPTEERSRGSDSDSP